MKPVKPDGDEVERAMERLRTKVDSVYWSDWSKAPALSEWEWVAQWLPAHPPKETP